MYCGGAQVECDQLDHYSLDMGVQISWRPMYFSIADMVPPTSAQNLWEASLVLRVSILDRSESNDYSYAIVRSSEAVIHYSGLSWRQLLGLTAL